VPTTSRHTLSSTGRYVAGCLPDLRRQAHLLLSYQFLKAQAIAAQAQSATPPATPGLIDPKAQVSTDSIVGFSTKVGERTNVKKSVVGRHCVIGRNVRINGCVIMDFVVVGDGYVSLLILLLT